MPLSNKIGVYNRSNLHVNAADDEDAPLRKSGMGEGGRTSSSQGHLGDRAERHGDGYRAMGESTSEQPYSREGLGYGIDF